MVIEKEGRRDCYICFDLQEGSLTGGCLSSTCVNFVLAEGIQSNMQMQDSETNVPGEEKVHLDVAFKPLNEDLMLLL